MAEVDAPADRAEPASPGIGRRVIEGVKTLVEITLKLFSTKPGQPLRQAAYDSDLRDTRIAALLGSALGVAFTVCFLTGLISHVHQSPQPWLSLPTRPIGLYRFTQSLHVATGIASIPLLLAKLWTVWPRVVQFPPVHSIASVVERLSLIPLVGGSLFLLFTGTANLVQWYPWAFDFRATHFWLAWITIGALVAHIGAKWTKTRASLGRGAAPLPLANPPSGDVAEVGGGGLTRRGFVGTVAAASGALTIATVGQTVRPFNAISLLAPRDLRLGPQGIPINRSAEAAGVIAAVTSPAYRLVVSGRRVSNPLALSVDDLRALATRKARLPIQCVEGWSATGNWRGISVRDLLRLAGAPPGSSVRIESPDPGRYGRSELTADQVDDPDALLATHLRGELLHIQHGAPVRLIAPNRPGVLQTKWVTTVVVL